MTRPLPWSHSSLQGFDTCARQYEEIKVLRHFKSQPNDASIWGNRFHEAAETYLGGNGLDPEFKQYLPYFDKFKNLPGKLYVEQQLALDKKLQPCAFNSPDVWGRGIIDVLVVNGEHATVADHKTGKRKKDMQQLIIFALLVFYHYPQIQTCVTQYHWLQESTVDSETFHRKDCADLWATLVPKLQRYASAFHVGVFPAKPSGLCRKHCPVQTCEYFTVGMYRG